MDASVQLPQTLFSKLSQAVERVSRHHDVLIISHYDADGISSAGILCSALLIAGKRFQVTLYKNLNEKGVERIKRSGAECVILSDMGASYIRELEGVEADVVVLDHHRSEDDSEKVIHVNPHLFGIDGMTSGCAAAVCAMFAIQMNDANWPLVQIALAGMVGDRQHINGMSGLNAYLVNEAERRGLIKISKGSLIPRGTLSEELFISTDPYIVGVSGDLNGVEELLKEADVPPEASFDKLDEGQRRKLSSLIALRLLEQGVSPQTLEEATREHYDLPDWGVEAEEFSALLNACGRMEREGQGIAAAMGDEHALTDAKKLRQEYKEQVLRGLKRLQDVGLDQKENVQYFYNDNPGLAGVICGISMQYFADPGMPTFGLTKHEKVTRVSGRATWDLLDKGVDLSTALKEASESVGGTGGGHRIASGASVPSGREDDFLNALDRIVGRQKG